MADTFHANMRTISIVIGMVVMMGTALMSYQSNTDCIKSNTREIGRVDTLGCKPSFEVRTKLVEITADQRHMTESIEKLEGTIKELVIVLREIQIKGQK